MARTTLPLGTVRYSIGVENKKGLCTAMSDPSHTPWTIRRFVKNYSSTKGERLRVIKYTLLLQNFHGFEQPCWHADVNAPKGLRHISLSHSNNN